MNENQEPEENEAGNSFVHLVNAHRRGVVGAKASDALAEAIEVARERGAMATVTVTFKLKPQNNDQIVIEADVSSKLPKEIIPSGMMYMDEDNCLHTSDPRQRKFEFKEVKKPSRIKEIPKKTVKEA